MAPGTVCSLKAPDWAPMVWSLGLLINLQGTVATHVSTEPQARLVSKFVLGEAMQPSI